MAMAVFPSYNVDTDGNISYPRDISFSSYLDKSERDFIRNLAESMHSSSPTDQETSNSPRVSVWRNHTPRHELGVFKAEKYFNEKLKADKKKNLVPRKHNNNGRSSSRPRREKRDESFERKSSKSATTSNSSLKSSTPSVKSETNWNNSQFGVFLPRKAGLGLKFFSGLQCIASCFEKINNVHHPKPMMQSPNSHQENDQPARKYRLSQSKEHFAFPIIDTANKSLEDQPRKSLEVFGVHQLGKKDIEQNLERKLSILTWEAFPNSCPPTAAFLPFPNPNKKSVSHMEGAVYDQLDARSDASSDLFEIENLHGEPPSRSVSDLSSCIMTHRTNYCAPSEASIDWTEVTYSIDAPFSPPVPDNEKKTSDKIQEKKMSNEINKVQNMSSSNGGLTLGCISHKAVDVMVNKSSYIRNEKGKFVLQGSPDIVPSTPSRRPIQAAARTRVKCYALSYA